MKCRWESPRDQRIPEWLHLLEAAFWRRHRRSRCRRWTWTRRRWRPCSTTRRGRRNLTSAAAERDNDGKIWTMCSISIQKILGTCATHAQVTTNTFYNSQESTNFKKLHTSWQEKILCRHWDSNSQPSYSRLLVTFSFTHCLFKYLELGKKDPKSFPRWNEWNEIERRKLFERSPDRDTGWTWPTRSSGNDLTGFEPEASDAGCPKTGFLRRLPSWQACTACWGWSPCTWSC